MRFIHQFGVVAAVALCFPAFSAAIDWTKYIEFRDAEDSATVMSTGVKAWKAEEKTKVAELLRDFPERGEGLLQRATAVATNKNDLNVLISCGKSNLALGEFDAAVADAVLRVFPRPAPEAVQLRVDARIAAGDRVKCLAELDALIAKNPGGDTWQKMRVAAVKRLDESDLSKPVQIAATKTQNEWPMFGGSVARNMVYPGQVQWREKFSVEKPLWESPTGPITHGSPIVSGGRVFIGTNSQAGHVPGDFGYQGCLMAFDSRTGKFQWQLTRNKLESGRANDWPQTGICSTACVEGDRLWVVTNRAELLCLDVQGFQDGENDGAITDEPEQDAKSADIVWRFDMIKELGVYPHMASPSSPLVYRDKVFVTASNGVDQSHVNLPAPNAPSFLALDKTTGKIAWTAKPEQPILHEQWSSPALGIVGGHAQVFFGGGDGWMYAFDAETGKLIWKFDGNPKDSKWTLDGRATRSSIVATPAFVEDSVIFGMGQDPEHGEGEGHLYRVKATLQGDVTNSGMIWHYGGTKGSEIVFGRTLSTVAVSDGLVYANELRGFVHCLDLQTGAPIWKDDMLAAIWNSPLIVGDKLIVTDEDGDVCIYCCGRELKRDSESNAGDSVYATPATDGSVLYVPAKDKLLGIQLTNTLNRTPAAPKVASSLTPAAVKPATPPRSQRPQDSPATPVTASDPWLNKKFMPRKGAKFMMGAREIAPDELQLPHLVTKLNGDWLWVGKAWVQKSDLVPFESAADYYTEYLQSNPRSSWAYNMRGISRSNKVFDEDAKAKAFADYTESIRLDPNNAAAFFNRGGLNAPVTILSDDFFASEEDLEKAVQDYSAAIRIDPNYVDAYFARGLIRHQLTWDDPKNESLNDLTKAIQIGLETADAARAYLGRGEIWYAKEQYDKAIADFGEAIRLDLKYDAPYFQRANAWKKKGNFDQAIADYTTLIEIDDEDESPVFLRGKLWAAKGDQAKASADFATAVRLKPDYAARQLESALDSSKKKRYELAIEYSSDAIYLDPKFADAFNNRAWLHATCPEAKHRNGKQAMSDAKNACELTAWKNAGYLDTLAAAYAESGDFPQAIESINKAIALAANDDEKQTYRTKLRLFELNKPYRTE